MRVEKWLLLKIELSSASSSCMAFGLLAWTGVWLDDRHVLRVVKPSDEVGSTWCAQPAFGLYGQWYEGVELGLGGFSASMGVRVDFLSLASYCLLHGRSAEPELGLGSWLTCTRLPPCLWKGCGEAWRCMVLGHARSSASMERGDAWSPAMQGARPSWVAMARTYARSLLFCHACAQQCGRFNVRVVTDDGSGEFLWSAFAHA
ncbi:hypothetical protein Dimus_029171 [Dionaea muscipula]